VSTGPITDVPAVSRMTILAHAVPLAASVLPCTSYTASGTVDGYVTKKLMAAVLLAAGEAVEAFLAAPAAQVFIPAIPVAQSVSDDCIYSLIDGTAHVVLARHLAQHGLSPEQYRERYGLPPDYPLVAPVYSRARSALAKRNGLGKRIRKNAPAATIKSPW
jgi:predicted transcriptional regulator